MNHDVENSTTPLVNHAAWNSTINELKHNQTWLEKFNHGYPKLTMINQCQQSQPWFKKSQQWFSIVIHSLLNSAMVDHDATLIFHDIVKSNVVDHGQAWRTKVNRTLKIVNHGLVWWSIV